MSEADRADALDPMAPVYIGPTACRFLAGDDEPANDITLHDRHDPCGHADPDTALPTFVGFVANAAIDREVSVGPCSFCGDGLTDPTPPVGDETDTDDSDDPAWTPASAFTDTDDVGETRTCQNCGAEVTRRYVEVFEPDGVEQPRCCPECEDVVRDGNVVRKKRGQGVQ